MTTYEPIYRMTVYADEAMSTALTPASGAPHSDPFQVATTTGVTGYKPYMGLPRGPRGEMDPLERTVSTGQLTIELLDHRTTEGGSNLERWVTAFTGNEDGDPQLGGLLVKIEESLDGGSTWSDFFTGRVHRDQLDGRVKRKLSIRDRSKVLNRTIFVGRPHGSASGFMPSLWPVGLTSGYGNAPTIDPMTGVYRAGSEQFDQHIEVDGGQERNIVTQDLHNRLADAYEDDLQTHPSLRAKVTITSGDRSGESGEFRLAFFERGDFDLFYIGETSDGGTHWIEDIGVAEVDSSDPNYMALPPDGASVEVEIFDQRSVDEGSPVLVDDIHPAQLLLEVARGWYGYLDDDGSPLEPFPHNESVFNDLIADTSFPDIRLVITEPIEANKFIEKICRHTGLGYRFG